MYCVIVNKDLHLRQTCLPYADLHIIQSSSLNQTFILQKSHLILTFDALNSRVASTMYHFDLPRVVPKISQCHIHLYLCPVILPALHCAPGRVN